MNAELSQSMADVPVDREARFHAFVDEHRERSVRMAYRLIGGDMAAAEDVAQDAFARAYRGLSRFRDEAKLSTWFYRILVRQAANYRRWRGVRQRWAGMWHGDAPDPNPKGKGDPGLREAISQAMEGLTGHQRNIFTLVHLEGFTVREAAGIVGCAEGTAKSHLHRALGRLREELAGVREEQG